MERRSQKSAMCYLVIFNYKWAIWNKYSLQWYKFISPLRSSKFILLFFSFSVVYFGTKHQICRSTWKSYKQYCRYQYCSLEFSKYMLFLRIRDPHLLETPADTLKIQYKIKHKPRITKINMGTKVSSFLLSSAIPVSIN